MVELVFIHLPKTGGSSILQTLKTVYGEEAVRHFERDECLDLKAAGKRISDVLKRQVKVIHGHFLYEEVEDIVVKDQPKLLTFMRQPNERVISNFNWWKRTIEENPEHPAKERADETLRVYASHHETQNKMSRFLRGASLEQFYFIGFLENFDTDLQRLAEKLNWPALQVFHEKKGQQPKKAKTSWADRRTLRKIERYNQEDWNLYRAAREKTLAAKQEL